MLPSESCRGLFIVPVALGPGGGTTVDLLLDTGSTWTFIDPAAVRQVTSRRRGRVRFAEARIGGHALGPLPARLIPMQSLSRAVGREIDGILGFPAFRDVLLTLDYPAAEVRVATGRLPPADGREVFRYTTRARRPHLPVEVGGRRIELLLDSGSTGRFLLRPADPVRWRVPPRAARVTVGIGFAAIDDSGRMEGALRFGPLRFEEPIVTVAGRERLAGWQVLRHFSLTFDQLRRRVRMVAPRSRAVVRMAAMTSNGLATRPRAEGLEVVEALAGTSAAEVGLRRGDLVVAIDGVPVHDRSCGELGEQLPGRRQLVTYLRGGRRAQAVLETGILIP